MKPQIMPMQDAAAYRQVLRRKKSELLSELRSELAAMIELQEQDDPRAATVQDRSVLERLANLDYKELKQVDAAMDRLEAGTYGTCSECGRLIDARRLDALPWAVRCRFCEERNAALLGAT